MQKILDQVRQRIVEHTAPAEPFATQQCLIFADGVRVHTEGDWHEARVA